MEDTFKEEEKPEVELIDQDGNAYAIIGKCMRAARKAGWSAEKITLVRQEMTSGDYDHLLRTVMKYFYIL